MTTEKFHCERIGINHRMASIGLILTRVNTVHPWVYVPEYWVYVLRVCNDIF